MATVPELTALLTEAKSAYHDLMIGKAVALARDQNGEEVRYTQADRNALASYIAALTSQIAVLNGVIEPPLGPMRLLF